MQSSKINTFCPHKHSAVKEEEFFNTIGRPILTSITPKPSRCMKGNKCSGYSKSSKTPKDNKSTKSSKVPKAPKSTKASKPTSTPVVPAPVVFAQSVPAHDVAFLDDYDVEFTEFLYYSNQISQSVVTNYEESDDETDIAFFETHHFEDSAVKYYGKALTIAEILKLAPTY